MVAQVTTLGLRLAPSGAWIETWVRGLKRAYLKPDLDLADGSLPSGGVD